ncbi:putative protein isoform X1 [Capsicum annuum]
MASRAPSAIFSCPPCNAYGLACESTDCVLFRVFLDSNNECFQTLMKFYKKPQLVIMLNTLLRIGDVIGDSKFALEWAELLAIQIRSLNIQSGNALNRIIAIETAIKQLNIQSGNALNRINAIEMAIEQLNIQSGNALNRLNAIEINFDAFRNVQGARNINLIESDDPQRRFMANNSSGEEGGGGVAGVRAAEVVVIVSSMVAPMVAVKSDKIQWQSIISSYALHLRFVLTIFCVQSRKYSRSVWVACRGS